MDNVTVDWQNYRSQGYARAAIKGYGDKALAAAHFDVPLISHVTGGLWQGGCFQGAQLDHDFDLVVSLYKWEQYALGPNTERVEIEAYDNAKTGFDWDDLDRTSQIVVDALDADKKVLVHCQAGLNRSGLVAGRALVKLGYTPEDAIALLRESRHRLVLCNETFEKQLLSFGE